MNNFLFKNLEKHILIIIKNYSSNFCKKKSDVFSKFVIPPHKRIPLKKYHDFNQDCLLIDKCKLVQYKQVLFENININITVLFEDND